MTSERATPTGKVGVGEEQATAVDGASSIPKAPPESNSDALKEAARDAFCRDPHRLLQALGLNIDERKSNTRTVWAFRPDGETKASIAVTLTGQHAGTWTDHGRHTTGARDGHAGDCFNLAQTHGGAANFAEALVRLCEVYSITTPTAKPSAKSPSRSTSSQPPAEPPAKSPEPIAEKYVSACAKALQSMPELVKWLENERGFETGLLEWAGIGLERNVARITIPVRDLDGTYRDVRKWRIPDFVCEQHGLKADRNDAKMLPARSGDGTGSPRIYDPGGCLSPSAAGPVVFCEGEWDTLKLIAEGHNAFTVTNGAKKWPDGQAANPPPTLHGRIVYMLGDHDPAGDEHNRAGAENCYNAGARCCLAVPWPSDFTHGGDPCEWWASQRTAEGFAELIRQAVFLEPPEGVKASRPAPIATGSDLAKRIAKVSWLWPGWIPRGCLTFLGGKPKAGKSSLAVALGNVLRTGTPWPDGAANDVLPGARTFYADTEAGLSIILQRCEGWGVDPDTFLFAVDEQGMPRRMDLDPDGDGFAEIRARLAIEPTPLLVIDSLRGALGRVKEDSSETQVWLTPWAELAREMNIAILVVHHTRKGEQGSNRAYTLEVEDLRGSTALGAIARSIILLDNPDPASPYRRLRVAASNFAAPPDPIGVEITESALEFAPANEAPRPQREDTAQQDAEDWLHGYLLAHGKTPKEIVLQAGQQAGHTGRTIERAKGDDPRIRDVKDPDNRRKRLWYVETKNQ